ncbi:MAG: MurR/RpiR family transcriptional regulator [Treponema sp.]|nr:MurR/RpiR family transcriptional regulator [Treponema sp.]
MPNSSCMLKIHEVRHTLSAKEQMIADFILQHPQSSVHPTIEELAEQIGVSEATLFRFVKKLGYAGYQQFRIALATDIASPQQRVYETTIDRGLESTVSLVFRTNINAMEETLKHIDPELIQHIAQLCIKSSTLYFFGLGGSSIVALDAYHKLVRTGLSCCAPMDFHMQLMQASQLSVEDTAFLISHTGVNRDALHLAETIKQQRAKLIVITDARRSPLLKLANHSLFAYAQASPFVSEAFSARIVQLALIDCLYVSIMEQLGQSGFDHLERMRSVIAQRRI